MERTTEAKISKPANQAGVQLVEVGVLTAVVGVLLAVAVPPYQSERIRNALYQNLKNGNIELFVNGKPQSDMPPEAFTGSAAALAKINNEPVYITLKSRDGKIVVNCRVRTADALSTLREKAPKKDNAEILEFNPQALARICNLSPEQINMLTRNTNPHPSPSGAYNVNTSGAVAMGTLQVPTAIKTIG